MRKLAIGLALASTALASPAFARDNQWYVELDGGAMIVEDLDFDIGALTAPATAGINNGVTLDTDYGFDFGGIVGYDFGAFRVEAEVSYREAPADDLRVGTGVVVPTSGLGAGAVAPGSYDVGGDVNALSFMINGLLDFGPDDGVQGFIGGGAGVARVDTDLSIRAGGPGFVDDSDTGFAWQALAGIRAPLTPNWDVGVKYRFFNADNVKLVDSLGRRDETRFRSHSLLGTLTYNFGGVEPMPEPAYVPPPPPPPPPPPREPAYIPPPPPPPMPTTGERG
jgi:opacity protein-like surface antigen